MQEAQRLSALAVRAVLDGAALPVALGQLAPRGRDAVGRRRALVQELAFGTLRHWGTLAALVRKLAAKPFADPALSCLVAVAIYQIDHTRAPPFAIVDRAVDAAAVIARPAAKSLVNALLRRYLREREALLSEVRDDPVARWSHPAWWIERLRHEFPETWQDILTAGNARPPLALRVNRRVTTREALRASWHAASISAGAQGDAGLLVDAPRPAEDLPGYAEGAFSVQDLGAQLAAPMLRLAAGLRVLDACAAPGGKATHIAELADVELVALDDDSQRLTRVRENFDRLRVAAPNVRVVTGDAGEPSQWWDGRPFDRILADVPCTASGIVRRHPDVKWLRRESDVARFAAQQSRILDALWPCVARGGLLLYATCSVFAAENEEQIAAFAARHPEALRESLTFASDVARRGAQLLPSSGGAGHNQDGFFYALLRKP
ncbi:MAG TPA: 16S rRNA (cytosine(967)-C(5))-methyltransferase RsmB [Casimicrobiaceae bacterium]|nr:16S rRNA (cytosine(967)-C(5))-methyltransferase RsmB [Casimicrobiaceae bacterium]